MALFLPDDTYGSQRFVAASLLQSDIYSYLYACMQHDPKLMELHNRIPAHQPRAVLFFTLVNYLLRRYPDPLAAYYPILAQRLGIPLQPVERMYPVFQKFAQTYRQEIEALIEDGVRLQ